MARTTQKLPLGNLLRDGIALRSTAELGALVRSARQEQGLTQLDLAGTANTGNRFVVDLEKGKPTLQLQKTLDALALLGLEVVIRSRRPGT